MEFFGLPHRPPFVFVREVVRCEPGLAAECATWFAADDPMFAGHFPGDPLVPGVIITEALAQTAGIAAASTSVTSLSDAGPRYLLSAIRQMKFLKAVRPDERIILKARKEGEADRLLQFRVEAVVNGETAASGQLVLNAIA